MPVAGDKVRASDVTDLFALKAANESVTSSTTLQDDDELFVTVEADSIYVVHAVFLYDASTAGDLKFTFTAPSGATFQWNSSVAALATTGATSPGTTNFAGSDIGTNYGAGGAGAGTTLSAVTSGVLVTSSTAGAFRVQFAQFTSDATATRMLAGSFLHLRKVG